MTHRLIKEQADFRGVLFNWDDQVTVRNLLLELVPPESQALIVARYNRHVRDRNKMAEEFNRQDQDGSPNP